LKSLPEAEDYQLLMAVKIKRATVGIDTVSEIVAIGINDEED